MCYYGSHPIAGANDLDARDLVQFIPRAFVFIAIVALYSRLFSFLRRPDTIQLSSQFVSGGINTETGREGQMGKMLRRFGGNSRADAAPRRIEPLDPDAPWEQLEFVQIGSGKPWDTPKGQTTPVFEGPTGGILLNSRPPSPKMGQPLLQDTPSATPTSMVRGSSSSSEILYTVSSSQRPSEAETLVSPSSFGRPIEMIHSSSSKTHILSPVHSAASQFDGKSIQLGDEEPTGPEERRPSGQSLKEFFQENQATHLDDDGRGPGSGTNGKGVQMSATAYFNRQASLLMLYFPLAVSFSLSTQQSRSSSSTWWYLVYH